MKTMQNTIREYRRLKPALSYSQFLSESCLDRLYRAACFDRCFSSSSCGSFLGAHHAGVAGGVLERLADFQFGPFREQAANGLVLRFADLDQHPAAGLESF